MNVKRFAALGTVALLTGFMVGTSNASSYFYTIFAKQSYAVQTLDSSLVLSGGAKRGRFYLHVDQLAQVPGNCTAAGVSAWLAMDEASGNLTVPTSPVGCASAGKVFVAHGSPTYHYTTGVPNGLNYAILFNGSTDYFAAATTNSMPAMKALTAPMVVEGWAAYTTTAGDGTLISNIEDSGQFRGWAVYTVSHAALRFIFRNSAGAACAATQTITLNTAHYFRATWTNSTGVCSMSIDGATPTTSTQAGMIGTSDAGGTQIPGVGKAWTGGSVGSWTGWIADARVTIGNTVNKTGYLGTGTLDVKIQEQDPLTKQYLDLTNASFATVDNSAARNVSLELAPLIDEIGNSKVSGSVPSRFRAESTVTNYPVVFSLGFAATVPR